MFDALLDLLDRGRRDRRGEQSSGLRGMLDAVLDDDQPRRDDRRRTDDHDDMDDDFDWERRRPARRRSASDQD